MRILHCKPFLEKNIPSREVSLNNTRLVIDGQNYFYQKYKLSNLAARFGCECDKYANFLREQLTAFRRANVQCYFVFKGGHASGEPLSEPASMKQQSRELEPPLTREVYKQLLDELGFDYAVCEDKVNNDCVALAQRLQCPLLANNVDYFFRGVQYMPFTTLDYTTLRGRMFELNSLKTMYNIDDKQVATFIALFDSNIFNSESLEILLTKLRLNTNVYSKIDCFLRWLAREGDNAATVISDIVSQDAYLELSSEITRINDTIVNKQEPGGLPAQYFLDRSRCQINEADPQWFAKGVVLKHIPIPYINLYKRKIVESFVVDNDNDEDSFLLAAPIVRYAFDLLTNFNKEELIFKSQRRMSNTSIREDSIEILESVQKPKYGSGNVFQNGWDNIGSFGLFEHFLSETLQISDWGRLERAPGDAKLLIISLAYLSRRRGGDVSAEVHAALLCYALLAASPASLGDHGGHLARAITHTDRKAALKLMDKYFHTSDKKAVPDRSMLHPLEQLVHCLRQINFLNTLCGSTFPPTVYSKTYNGTFVYNIVYDIKRKFGGDARRFLEHELQSVPTVLSFLYGVVDLYNEIK